MALSWPSIGAAGSYVTMSVGTLGAITQGAYSIVGLMLPYANRGCLLGIQRTSSYDRQIIIDSGPAFFGGGDFSAGYTPTGGINVAGTKWQWVGQRKAAGTQVYRWSYRNYTDNGTYQQASGTGTHTDGAAATVFRIGQGDDEGRNGIALIALWNRDISDSEMQQAMGSAASAIYSLTPDALWLLNVAGPSSIVDSMGNGANYSSVSGGANITVISDPSGYDFSLTSGLTIGHGGTKSTEQWGTSFVSSATGLFVPGSVQSSERFGSGLITPGTATTVPGVTTGNEQFGTAIITPGTSSATPGPVTSKEQFGTALLGVAGTPSTAPGITASSEQFGSGTLSGSSAVTVTPGVTAVGERWGSATLAAGALADQFAVPGSVVSSERFGSATLSAGTSTITPGTIGPTEQFGTATMGGVTGAVVPGAIVTQERFGSAALATGIGTITPASIAPSERWGSAVLSGSPVTVSPGTAGLQERWGSANIQINVAIVIAPGTIGSAHQWGTSYLEYGRQTPTQTVKLEQQRFEVKVEIQEFRVRYPRQLIEVEMEL